MPKYIIWTKDEFNDFWARQEIIGEDTLKTEIINAMKSGKEIEITQVVDYKISVSIARPAPAPDPPAPPAGIKTEEVKQIAKTGDEKDKTAGHKNTRNPGDGPV